MQEANNRWLKIISIDPGNEAALFSLCENYLKTKDGEGISLCSKAIKQLPATDNSQKRLELLAKLSNHEGQYNQSIEYWKEAINNGAKTENANLRIANLYLASGEITKSLEHLQIAEKDPSIEEQVLIGKIRCQMHLNKYHDAISLIHNSDPALHRKSNILILLFKSYLALGNLSKSKRVCKYLHLNLDPVYYYLQGILNYNLFDYKSAYDSFQISARVFNHSDSQVWLIKVLNVLQDSKTVLDAVRSAERNNKNDYLIQGRCWEAAGYLSAAGTRYKKSVRIRGDYESFLTLINFYFNNKNYGKALYTLRRARKQRVNSTVFNDIEKKVLNGMLLTGSHTPQNLIKLSRYDYYINDHVYKCIIGKASKRYNAEVLNSSNTKRSISRIALIISSLGPGGAERQIVNLANGLIEYEDVSSINLLCTHLDRREQDRFYEDQLNSAVTVSEYYRKDETIDPYALPELAEYADLLSHIQPVSRQQVILHLARQLIETRPDVVHAWLDETFINAVLVCSMLGIKNVVGRWGSMPPGVSRTVSEKDTGNVYYQHAAYAQISKLFGLKFSSNSLLTGQAYAKILGVHHSNVHTVYNGLDANSLMPDQTEINAIKRDLNIADDDHVVGTVFRMSEEKRPFLWIDVAEKISHELPDTHFVIVGTGPLESAVVDYINKKNLPNIHLVGKQQDVANWYTLFDVLLMTSRVEGVSNVVIESQYCGTPVVAPKVGGMPEAILDNKSGYLLTNHSADSFTTTVLSILNDQALRSRLSLSANRFAKDKFSESVMVENYANLYRSSTCFKYEKVKPLNEHGTAEHFFAEAA